MYSGKCILKWFVIGYDYLVLILWFVDRICEKDWVQFAKYI